MSWRWLPNAICVLRMLLAVPLAVLLVERSYVAALCVLVIAGVSDGLDGFLAKTFDWRTRLGGLLDPAADKLLLVTAFCSLTYVGLTPLDLTAVVIGRDVVIVAGALTYQVLIAPVQGEPARISKLNTACQLGFVFFANLAARARRGCGVHESRERPHVRAPLERARVASRARCGLTARWANCRWR
jgi:cardiolipin synthase